MPANRPAGDLFVFHKTKTLCPVKKGNLGHKLGSFFPLFTADNQHISFSPASKKK